MKELYICLIAASPLIELRGAIPLALGLFHFSWEKALFLSVLGNLIPFFPIFWILTYFSQKLRSISPKIDKFFYWLFARTRAKFQGKWAKFGKAALIIFVAIPLPFTGAWTGTLAAFLFGIEQKEAFWRIALGVLLAGILVTLLTLLGIKIF